MKKTTSRSTKRIGSTTNLIQKTEKKKAINAQVPIFSKTTAYLNKQKISIYLQEATQNTWNMDEGTSWNKILTKKHLRVVNHSQIRINRARIFDWLLQVCCSFQLRWQTYWCTIELIDYLIYVIDCVKINNLLIISVTSLFISTKIHQTNPPTLKSLVDRAVYECFTEKDVIDMEGFIILQCSNHEIKPRYMETIYNCLYQLEPELSLEERIQSIRRFILIWMDPVASLKLQQKNCDNELENNDSKGILISYEDIVKTVVEGVLENRQNTNFNKVHEFYKTKYECQNIQRDWKGFQRLRM